MNHLRVGTSGWSYKDWAAQFYPEDLPAKDQLGFYATIFNTVEINATFYRLPTLKAVRGWHDRVPPDFQFSIKGSRYITHTKRIRDCGEAVENYFERLHPLGDRLAVVLWQLPPSLKRDVPLLEDFIEILPPGLRHAIEFRHDSWIGDEVTGTLGRRNIANVLVSSSRMPMDRRTPSSDFGYIRFHGLEGGPAHDYTRHELEPWADIARQWIEGIHGESMDVFAYFNNDVNVRAPANALLFERMVKERVGSAIYSV
jgi:uncharacterized protein YecE (DUF72 family)